MDDEKKLNKYRYLWTTLRDKIVLFTVDCYGEKEYLIYYLKTKRIQLIAKSEMGNRLVQRLIENGIPVLEDKPADLDVAIQRDTVKIH